MAQNYSKLDWNWSETPEAALLWSRYGRKAVLDWILVITGMSMFGGSIDLNDEMQLRALMRLMHRNETGVMRALDRCAECGLIDADAWHAFRRAGSARAMRDARAREGRKEWGDRMQELSAAERKAQEGAGKDG